MKNRRQVAISFSRYSYGWWGALNRYCKDLQIGRGRAVHMLVRQALKENWYRPEEVDCENPMCGMPKGRYKGEPCGTCGFIPEKEKLE